MAGFLLCKSLVMYSFHSGVICKRKNAKWNKPERHHIMNTTLHEDVSAYINILYTCFKMTSSHSLELIPWKEQILPEGSLPSTTSAEYVCDSIPIWHLNTLSLTSSSIPLMNITTMTCKEYAVKHEEKFLEAADLRLYQGWKPEGRFYIVCQNHEASER